MAARKLPLHSTARRDAAAFLGQHDESVAGPAKIKEGLEKLLKIGREEWRYEIEFCKLTGIGLNKIPAFRAGFAPYLVEIPGRDGTPRTVWFADKGVAAAMRKRLGKVAA